MTTLTRPERKVLATINRHGTVAVGANDTTAKTVRALARRGLVDYQPTTGVVRRKEK